MKIILQNNNIFVLRFDPNEEVIVGLNNFATANHITAGSLTAIGATKEVLLSYYNLATKQYEDITISEDLEIVSMLGHIATMDEKIIIHCHGSFSDRTFQVKAGHVKKLIVSATCEVTLVRLEGKMERAFDQETGVNLLQ